MILVGIRRSIVWLVAMSKTVYVKEEKSGCVLDEDGRL